MFFYYKKKRHKKKKGGIQAAGWLLKRDYGMTTYELKQLCKTIELTDNNIKSMKVLKTT